MALILSQLTALWIFLATLSRRASLRFLVLIAGLVFFVFPPSIPLFKSYQKVVLELAAFTLPEAPRGNAKVAIVTVPQSEIETWQSDTYVSSTFSSLLSNILESRNTNVGVILREPVNTFPTAVDGQVNDGPFNQVTERDVYLKHKSFLMDLLQDPRVVTGLQGAYTEDLPSLKVERHQDVFSLVDHALALWRPCENCDGLKISQKPQYYFYMPQAASEFVPLINRSSEDSYANFFLALLNANLSGSNKVADMVWRERDGIFLGSTRIPLSANGTVLPLSAYAPKHAQAISWLSFEEAVVSNAFPEIVLIVSERDTELAAFTAKSIQDISNKRYFYSPWWAQSFVQLSYLLLTLCLVWLISRVTHKNIFWAINSGVVASLVLGQIAVAMIWQWWLPLGSVAILYAVAACLVSFWQLNEATQRRYKINSQRHIHAAVNRLESTGFYRDAIDLLGLLPRQARHRERIFRLIDRIIDEQHNIDEALEILEDLREGPTKDRPLERKITDIKERASALSEDTLAATNSRPAEDLNVPKTLGRYQVQKELGRGAVGIVYLGFDPAISRYVAIKTLSYRQFSAEQIENLKSRFFREAEAAGRLSHPNIVSIYDVGEQGDQAYIAMDYVDGEALNHRAHEDRLLPVADVYRIIHDVALALDYAHSHQVIHRDVKPGNILYSAEPYQLKVADFGIARLLDNSRTTTGEILGSPLYMAPEQLKGNKVDVGADIFSLGVTFYQLLVGHLPFNAENLAGLTYEIIHNKHKSVRNYRKDLPASATRIVNQCLQKDPADRYESALELANVLKKAIRRDFPSQAREFGYM